MSFSHLFKHSLFISLLGLSTISIADEGPKTKPSWEFGAYLGQVTFDKSAATEESIEDEATILGFNADYVTSQWLTTIALDFFLYDDNAEFEQRTIDQFNNVEDSSSNALGISTTLAFGPKWQVGKNNSTLFYTQVGIASVISSERSIDRCRDCRSEDIDIDAGGFVRLGISQNVGAVSLGLNIVEYAGSDDIDRAINLTVGTKY